MNFFKSLSVRKNNYYLCDCENDICFLLFPLTNSSKKIHIILNNIGLNYEKNREIYIENLELEYYIFLEEVKIAIIKSKGIKQKLLKIRKQKFSENTLNIVSNIYLKVKCRKSNIDTKSNWGIISTHINKSSNTGKKIKVAILDSGYDAKHPDFKTRKYYLHHYLETNSIDYNGHGMHCTGIACGHKDNMGNGLRYGIASNSVIYSCKVLNHELKGQKCDIIRGILWAVNNECKVINLSLEIENENASNYCKVFERVIKYAFSRNSIVVAAVGNGNNRPIDEDKPISSPSDSPSCISVGGINQKFEIYFESNRADVSLKQKINVVAPAENIYSSWSTQSLDSASEYNILSGTSMATAFVTGIIALLWEKHPDKNSNFIINTLEKNTCFKNSWSENDAGNGLVKAI